MLLMPVGLCKTYCLTYWPTGGRKKELSWFFCRQSEPENIQGPVTGQGKTNSTEALQQQEPQIVERCQDYTQTIAAVLSEVSPEKKGATLIVVTRTGPRPQMLWNTFPSLPRAAARPSNQLPP